MKNKIIDIDKEFEDFSISEHEVRRFTAMKRVNGSKTKATIKKIKDTVTKQYKDPEYRAYRANIQHEVAQTKSWREAHNKGLNKRVENGWAEKNLKAREKTLKPIHTPYGDFSSKKEAVAGMTAKGVVNAYGKISVGLKTKPTEYYYIKDKQ